MKLTMMALMTGSRRVRCLFVALGWLSADIGFRRSSPDTPRVVGRNTLPHDDSPSLMGHGSGPDH